MKSAPSFLFSALVLCSWCFAQSPGAPRQTPNLESNIERPLRYTPEGTDFVIRNGALTFNRPLYGGGTAFRVESGDRPQYAFYLPGRGGVLRLGWRNSQGTRWCDFAADITARYRPGSMVHELRDPTLGSAVVRLFAVPTFDTEGLTIRVEVSGATEVLELFWAFGGITGQRGRRDADIGTENEPLVRWFNLKPEHCKGNRVLADKNRVLVRGTKGLLCGVAPVGASYSVADATAWPRAAELLNSAGKDCELPVALGRLSLPAGNSDTVLAFQRLAQKGDDLGELSTYLEVRADRPGEKTQPEQQLLPAFAAEELPAVHAAAETHRAKLASKLIVETPDPFVNAAAAALNLAGDGVWDTPTGTVMHGAVAWRSKLLGWRGPYLNDALGYHDRARSHIDYWSGRQNTSPLPETIPPADKEANLARNEAALHSNGDLSNSHYDMNLVFIDMVFRHLLWTGDLDLARSLWPMIERHLAWERRLFRRSFGTKGLPLYEAYCCIWASDDLYYSGGGATHSSAYNFFHNRMAARLARLLGKDPAPYEQEAELIQKGMRESLWLQQQGWYAEWRDLLGLGLAHPHPALWTFYHTVDSLAASPFEAWQMSRYVDTELPKIPLRGPGVPEGGFHSLPTTNWMPYTWSTNNVVMSEVAHTALAFWQAGRTPEAWRLFKGAVLDSMFMGLCPGNAGMCTQFDVARRETQRDFADSVGMMSRALVEGLFGVAPDALAGELRLRPGFPTDWDKATLHHQDLSFQFSRSGAEERFVIDSRFSRPPTLLLELPAERGDIASVSINGKPATWSAVSDAIGTPRFLICGEPSAHTEILVTWQDAKVVAQGNGSSLVLRKGDSTVLNLGPAEILETRDPQQALAPRKVSSHALEVTAAGLPGHRTAFVKLAQGGRSWWLPIHAEIAEPHKAPASTTDWNQALPSSAKQESVDLSGFYNDEVTRIFKNEYLSPRSPFCSLSMPTQGIGSWCHPKASFEVDDTGLRAAASAGNGAFTMPNGLRFAMPAAPQTKNIVFTSLWDNFPDEISVPLQGKASRIHLLMAGTTHSMQSRFDNGEVLVRYQDGGVERLALHNPTTWWPIQEDYFVDDFAYRREGPVPPRIDLKTGKIRIYTPASFKGQGGKVPGGAATVLELPLDPSRPLASLTVRALANEVIIGLMSATLVR